MNVLLTGVAQGLGKYLAVELTKRNHQIIGIDFFDKDKLDYKISSVLKNYFKIDLGKTDSIEESFKHIIKECNRIDILINNAGIKSFKLIADYTFEEIQYIYKVNTLAPIMLSKLVLNQMENLGYGRIINISSNASFYGYRKGSIYCSSKASLNLFTQAVKSEIKNKNITINSICPATIATDEYLSTHENANLKKFVLPKKILDTIEKIINSNMNGHIIPVISVKEKIKYFCYDIARNIKWFVCFHHA